MCYEGYLSLLHSRLCTLCIYVECYTENVIFRMCMVGIMKCKRRPVGTWGLKAKLWNQRGEVSKTFYRALHSLFDLMYWSVDIKELLGELMAWRMMKNDFPSLFATVHFSNFLIKVMDLTGISWGILGQSLWLSLGPVWEIWEWQSIFSQMWGIFPSLKILTWMSLLHLLLLLC